MRKISIKPIIQPQVEELENEPDKDRGEGRKKKIAEWPGKRRGICSSEIYAVEAEDERPPGQRKKPGLNQGNSKKTKKR